MKKKLLLNAFCDESLIQKLLFKAELGALSASDKARLFHNNALSLLKFDINGESPAYGFFIPGRIEILGKHTDYVGGSSIIATPDRGFCLIVVPRNDKKVVITTDGLKDTTVFELNPHILPKVGHWSNYSKTVARRIVNDFGEDLNGCSIAFQSDLPLASGMSSSSALMIGTFLAFSKVNDLENHPKYKSNIRNREDLAEYLASVENGCSYRNLDSHNGVGTHGGSEDHTAILNCCPDYLSEYSYHPLRFKRIFKMPKGYVFTIASSGIVAEKTGAVMESYNRASELISIIIDIWNKQMGKSDPTIISAISNYPDAERKIREILKNSTKNRYKSSELISRFEHFYVENYRIIPAAGDALKKMDLAELGRQVDRSQKSAELLLKNQVPETIFLAKSARELGAIAASAFGAGFGGSVWALVKKEFAQNFILKWQEQYLNFFPQRCDKADYFITCAGPSAFYI